MLELHFNYNYDLTDVGAKVSAAVAAKLTELTHQLYNKVQENLSGRILQKQSGQLAGSIQQTIETNDEVIIGTVFPSPASPKAWALEKGGVAAYDIVPIKAKLLHFITKEGQEVFAHHVTHPPSKEFAYLRLALEEMAPIIPAEFQQAIQAVFDGV